ncbi:MAG TPA: hypothetical protein VK168_13500 [Saprospiraceae bacterium]|nr:hypothetical protein [Saprospiraceae bacterium]
MANNTSPHILNTAANLLGFCLFVITSIHLSNQHKDNLVDEFMSVVSLLLAISSVLSFASIKTQNLNRERRLESVADVFFLIALIGIVGIIAFITVVFWRK